MTLLYRVGDEIILHAPREVLEEVVLAVEHYIARECPAAQIRSGLENFANSIRAEAQHRAPQREDAPRAP